MIISILPDNLFLLCYIRMRGDRDMKRSKKIVVISHCLLNVNAKVEGLAVERACAKKLIQYLIENDYGMIQLPCAEMDMCGINRWGQVKSQLDHPNYRRRCRELMQPVVCQIEDYISNGYQIEAVIGVDGSPTCGVNRTCIGEWRGEIGEQYHTMEKAASGRMSPEAGVMMEVLREMLRDSNISIPFYALDEESLDYFPINK